MSDSLAPASLTLSSPRTDAGMAMKMTMGAKRETKRKTGGGGETPRWSGPARRTVAPWTASEGCGRDIPCWWHAPGACRISGLVLPACRQHSLHGWPLVCAFRRGREERQFLSALCFSFFSGGEEAARQYTAITMILKSHAHTATRKFRRRGCCGSASLTTLHGARIIVHTLTSTQIFSFVG